MLNAGEKMFSYRFEGYWKDVGTVASLWQANMDLLDKGNELDLNDPTWKIYTEDVTTLPHYVSADAVVRNAYITQGCTIKGAVTGSVLFTNAKVGKDAKVIDSVLMPGVIVEDGAVVTRALVADGVKIGKGAVVREGKDVTIIATGIMVNSAMEAAEKLAEEGIDAEVLNIHTIKPLDEELVVASAKKTGKVVTAEEHSVIGGLGSAVCDCLCAKCPTPVYKIGMQDIFGESGSAADLMVKYEIDGAGVYRQVKEFLAKF